jgi:hypothetical protein
MGLLFSQPDSADAQRNLRQEASNSVDSIRDTTMKVHQSSRQRTDEAKVIDDIMKETSKKQPTQGTSESKAVKERAKILAIQAKHLYVIQVGLFTILLSILAYAVIPLWAANGIVILILATGIAAAIYLSQI